MKITERDKEIITAQVIQAIDKMQNYIEPLPDTAIIGTAEQKADLDFLTSGLNFCDVYGNIEY